MKHPSRNGYPTPLRDSHVFVAVVFNTLSYHSGIQMKSAKLHFD